MPTLTPEQQQKAIEWLESHWTKPKECEICNHNKWDVLQDVVTPAIFTGGFAIGTAYPQFMLMCRKCGLTKYFNAIHSGIIQRKEGGKG